MEADNVTLSRPVAKLAAPAAVSAIQVAETLKLLIGRESVLRNRLLMMDLLHHQYELIDFGE